LKVSHEVFALISALHSFDAVVDLVANIEFWQSAAGAEASIVTKSAAANGNGAINIWARETGVNADSLDTVSENAS
jgi:hypothetical protein